MQEPKNSLYYEEEKIEREDPVQVTDYYNPPTTGEQTYPKPRAWYHSIKEPGSALQVMISAALAVIIGIVISITVEEGIPSIAPAIVKLPGQLWLNALKAVVLPLIICAMILAAQMLKKMDGGAGARMGKATVLYYVGTTLLAVVESVLLVSLFLGRVIPTVSDPALLESSAEQNATVSENKRTIEDQISGLVLGFVPSNIFDSLASSQLLAVIVTSLTIGMLIKDNDGQSTIIKFVKEVESIVTIVITFLIKLAPVGVFFLILSNMLKLKIADMGEYFGYLVGGACLGFSIHLFIVLPLVFFAFTRQNPFAYFIRNSSASLTGFSTSSSAATLPVTLLCCDRHKIPRIVSKFVIPLGATINMDGTAIYFPVAVVFLAASQGIALSAADYVMIALVATLSSIGTTPIPSASLVLIVLVAETVKVPVTGMYALIVTIDWLLDRFRTVLNVNGDLYAAKVIAQWSGLTDEDEVHEKL